MAGARQGAELIPWALGQPAVAESAGLRSSRHRPAVSASCARAGAARRAEASRVEAVVRAQLHRHLLGSLGSSVRALGSVGTGMCCSAVEGCGKLAR